MMLAAALLAVGAPIGLRVAAAEGVAPSTAAEVSRRLSAALESASGRRVRVDSGLWDDCRSDADCRAKTSARLGVDELVLVRLYGAITLLRVEASRQDGSEPSSAQADLPVGTPERWGGPLEAVARALFPEPWRAPVPQVQVVAPVGPDPPSVAPWILLGGAGVTLGVGVALGVTSRSARGAAETAPDRPTYEREADRSQRLGIAANAMFGVAAAAAIAGGVWWWLD